MYDPVLCALNVQLHFYMERNFKELLKQGITAGRRLCIGLNTSFDRVPKAFTGESIAHPQGYYNVEVVKVTKHVALAYKINPAFYMAGEYGISNLEQTIAKIHELAPHAAVILDAGWGGTELENAQYATLANHWQVDAVTINPYFTSFEEMRPFLQMARLGVLVNSPDVTGKFEKVHRHSPASVHSLGRDVAHEVWGRWQTVANNCGFVVRPDLDLLTEIMHGALLYPGREPCPILLDGVPTGQVREMFTRAADNILIVNSDDVAFTPIEGTDMDPVGSAAMALHERIMGPVPA